MFAKVFELRRRQALPLSAEACWDFFSSPLNLPAITPPWLGFCVDPVDWDRMHPGMILKYHVSPLWGMRMRWVTEITHVQEPTLFVDEQRFGPYRLWHHQHHFRPIGDGVEMTDIVHYAIPYGWLGRTLLGWKVHRQVAEIFDYRFAKLEELFPLAGSAAREPIDAGRG